MAAFNTARAADAPSQFSETFTGAPSTPSIWSSPKWDVIVHDRSDGATNAMHADHDSMCGAPPATHEIHAASEAVFLCRDHLMTAINSSDPGYAVVYLTPAAMADWSKEVANIEFEVSTGRSTNRDWIDLWLTPWGENMVLPAESSTPDLNGAPRKALHFRLTNKFSWLIEQSPGEVKLSKNDWRDLPVPYSRVQRDRFTIAIGKGFISMRYTNVASGQSIEIEKVQLPPDLGFDNAVVQIGHHSYTPSKDCSFTQIGSCGPNTWHWDNVKISPSKHFSIRKQGRLTGAGAIEVSPGWLRFAARGVTELNWGGGWKRVDPVNGPAINDGHFASYFVAVPGDTTKVQMRGTSSWAGAWRAENISVWSLADR